MEKKVRVWDLAVRLGHWAMGALVLAAFLTSDEDETVPLHTKLGLVLLGVVVFRVAWGFVGSHHARFKDFVRAPRSVLAYAKEYAKGRPGAHLGHNPLGGAMVVAMLAVMAFVAITGVATYLGPEWGGPLAGVLTKRAAHAVKEVHEAAAWLLPWMVFFHVAGVVLSSVLEKQNLVWGMVTGKKRAPAGGAPPEPRFAARAAGFLAAAGMAIAAVFAIARLFPISEAEAATPPPALMDQYRQEARAKDPAFLADPSRGRALYLAEHQRDGKTTSCATCHTEDARKPGRSPVGKIIDPLAPSAEPARFTDRKKSDKWFDRNCKQVIGRPCDAGEKADLLAWLLTL